LFRYTQIKAKQTVEPKNKNRKEGLQMNKKLTRVFLAALLALSVTTAVLLPTITSVYAATAPTETPVNPNQPQTPQPPPTDPPKDKNDPHSDHH
jgi:hypothetical protein